MNKKAVSGIVAAVIMIGLVLAAGVIVWTVVNNMVRQNLEGAGSCVGIYDKVRLNPSYTCYGYQGTNHVVFSINREDIELDAIVIAISGGGSTASITMNSTGPTASVDGYALAADDGMPDKNSGQTYIYTGTDFPVVDSIEIAPVVDGKQCSPSDQITGVEDCTVVLS